MKCEFMVKFKLEHMCGNIFNFVKETEVDLKFESCCVPLHYSPTSSIQHSI